MKVAGAQAQSEPPGPSASQLTDMFSNLVDVATVTVGSAAVLPSVIHRGAGPFVLLVLRSPQADSSFGVDFKAVGSSAAPSVFLNLGEPSDTQAQGFAALIDGQAGEMHLKSASTGQVFSGLVFSK